MNLLNDPLLRVETVRGLEHLNLPSLLVCLGNNEVNRYIGLQRHQHDAFHVFLSYLASMVLVRGDESDCVQGEQYWRDHLFKLASDAGSDAWELVVDDPAKPAFMQPPLVPGSWKAKKENQVYAADKLDMLFTSKNHSVKQERAHTSMAYVDQWVYALITRQTMSGYSGKTHYGISRMNKGAGSRPIVELVRDRSPGARWADAVARLLAYRNTLIKDPYRYDPNGLALLWTEPWDGVTQLSAEQLDPFYIEICERIRLQGVGTIASAQYYGSAQTRIAVGTLPGVVGDPWIPIEYQPAAKKSNQAPVAVKPLPFSARGITASHLHRLIFEEDLALSVMQKPQPGWRGDPWLVVSVLVGGQCRTSGFHRREIQIPECKVKDLFAPRADDSDVAKLKELSKTAIEYAAVMSKCVLGPAVSAYARGLSRKSGSDDKAWHPVWRRASRRFELLWSDDFLPKWLFKISGPFDQEQELRRWAEILRSHAETVLAEVQDSAASCSARQYRVCVTVNRQFQHRLYKHFSILFEREVTHSDGDTADTASSADS